MSASGTEPGDTTGAEVDPDETTTSDPVPVGEQAEEVVDDMVASASPDEDERDREGPAAESVDRRGDDAIGDSTFTA